MAQNSPNPPEQPRLGVVFDEHTRQMLVGKMNDAQDDLLNEKADVTSTAVVAVADTWAATR